MSTTKDVAMTNLEMAASLSIGQLTPTGQRLFRYGSYAEPTLALYAKQFAEATPFPYLAIDDFIAVPEHVVVDSFPGKDWQNWNVFEDAYQYQKRTCSDIGLLPLLFQQMVGELSSPGFLAFLERITGIFGLIPDPYLSGGGLHSSGPGGILAPHTDFHLYGKLNLFRRINVLIYFNPHWQEDYGGSLELFKKGARTPSRTIVPEFGRMVFFLTDDRSVHGFRNPIVGPNRWRNSLALYYYTSEDTARFSGDGVTYWQDHGRLRGSRLARLLTYKVLLRGSWMLSKLAHRVNPNFNSAASPISKLDD